MAITRDIKTAKSSQEIDNLGFDTEFNLPVVENLVYNSTTGSMDRMEQPANPETGLAKDTTLTDGTQVINLTNALKILIQAVTYPPWFDRSVNQIRSQVSGSVTATVASTSIVNFGSFPADHLQRMENINAWANNIRSLIT
jgi:hypothetical protein